MTASTTQLSTRVPHVYKHEHVDNIRPGRMLTAAMLQRSSR